MPGEEGASGDTEKLLSINCFEAFIIVCKLCILVFLYRTSFLHSASYNKLAFDGQEKGFGISTESIGHLTRDLASVLIENGSDVEA